MSKRRGMGKFPSLKMQRMVRYRSWAELDLLFFLDFYPNILRFYENPPPVEYRQGQKTCLYQPGYYVVLSDQHVIVECLSSDFSGQSLALSTAGRLGRPGAALPPGASPLGQSLPDDNTLAKYRQLLNHYREEGLALCLLSHATLRSGCHLENVQLLTRYARYQVAPAIRERIHLALINTREPFTIRELSKVVNSGDPHQAVTAILTLAYRRELAVPLREAFITPDSPVSWAKDTGEPLVFVLEPLRLKGDD
ncbi:MAG: hypothetical protein L0332_25520 [Chloroflexi bacterium]|nr:hypothetical protein [Chloroflexota bacterium]MCI0575933.1 hypothetical protein [Chloroflexota bacterium]MCI0730058.1 hypothetical protein [Chloroflexota bacterium]